MLKKLIFAGTIIAKNGQIANYKHTHTQLRMLHYIQHHLIIRMRKGTNLEPGVHGAVSLRQYGDVESAIANVVGFALITSCTANRRR